MRFQPRHYLLIAVILAVGMYRFVQSRHVRSAGPINVVRVPAGPKPTSPVWEAFDKAAGLRDAKESEFAPALRGLQQAVDAATNDPTIADVKGCQTWLMFYREAVVHPSPDKTWRNKGTQHLDSCVATHHDEG